MSSGYGESIMLKVTILVNGMKPVRTGRYPRHDGTRIYQRQVTQNRAINPEELSCTRLMTRKPL